MNPASRALCKTGEVPRTGTALPVRKGVGPQFTTSRDHRGTQPLLRCRKDRGLQTASSPSGSYGLCGRGREKDFTQPRPRVTSRQKLREVSHICHQDWGMTRSNEIAVADHPVLVAPGDSPCEDGPVERGGDHDSDATKVSAALVSHMSGRSPL